MVGTARLKRVASVTNPFFIGTFISTRIRTFLPFKSKLSSVRSAIFYLQNAIQETSETNFRAKNNRFAPSYTIQSAKQANKITTKRMRYVLCSNYDAYISLPIATAVSAIRQEKPHSLSYQLSTRTNLPSSTFVCAGAKFDECVS